MKKILGMVLGCALMHSVYASETHLRFKISGPITDNTYFLCLNDSGCFSIYIGDKGKVYPMNGNTVENIFLVNDRNFQMSKQVLPKSCDVTLQGDQTLTVSGRLVKVANDKVFIQNMHCSVA